LPAKEIEKIDEARESLRGELDIIHERTTHVDPRNVHRGDAQGFEDSLAKTISGLVKLLALDDEATRRMWHDAPADVRKELEAEAGHASRHASEQPHPPRNTVGRLVANAKVKMDHSMRDVSARTHQARSTLDS
jgi:hypothetical protein